MHKSLFFLFLAIFLVEEMYRVSLFFWYRTFRHTFPNQSPLWNCLLYQSVELCTHLFPSHHINVWQTGTCLQRINKAPMKCILEQYLASMQAHTCTSHSSACATSGEAVNTLVCSFLSHQIHTSSHKHFCSVRGELQHVCSWQVLFFADSCKNPFCSRETHQGMAVLEPSLKFCRTQQRM